MTQASKDPGLFRETVVRMIGHAIGRIRYMLSADTRLEGRHHLEALDALRDEQEAIIAEQSDALLERIGYDVGSPSKRKYAKTRRAVRKAVNS